MAKKLKSFRGLGGLDTRVNREDDRLSDGMNFYTRNKALFTRPGLLSMNSISMQKMFTGKLPGGETVILAQNNNRLRQKVSSYFDDSVWGSLLSYTLSSDNLLSSCVFQSNIILANGVDRIKYNLTDGSITSLDRSGSNDDDIPLISKVISWKGRLFGWATVGTYATEHGNLLRFSGYDGDGIPDITYWPPDFSLNIGGDDGSQIKAVFASDSHLLCLTDTRFVQVFGDNEDNFEITQGGNTQVLNEECCTKVNNVIYWLAKDLNDHYAVMRYTGTEPVKVSYAVDSLLDKYLTENTFMREVNNQLWIICPQVAGTQIIVYDDSEAEWFRYELPVEVTDLIYYQTLDGQDTAIVLVQDRIIHLMEGVGEDSYGYIEDDEELEAQAPIITSFTIGPLNISDVTMKAKSIYFTALSENDYNLTVTQIVDQRTLSSKVVNVKRGNQSTTYMKLARVKGKNIAFLVTSNQSINNLFNVSFVYNQKAVK